MTIYKKPEKTIFASAAKVGEVLDFPDRARGWGVTLDQTNAIPPMEWFNNLQQVNDESIQYLLQYGVAIKDNETEYPVNAITNENGELYICKKQHVNKPVSNATYWEKIRKEASKTQAGVVELSSSVTSTDETKASTPKATKTAYDKAVQANDNANLRLEYRSAYLTNISDMRKQIDGIYTVATESVTDLPDNYGTVTIISNFESKNLTSGEGAANFRRFLFVARNGKVYHAYESGQVRFTGFKEIITEDKLTSSVTSNSTSDVATSKAVKTVNDKANKLEQNKLDKSALSSSVTSSSESNVATSLAVKIANDNANLRLEYRSAYLTNISDMRKQIDGIYTVATESVTDLPDNYGTVTIISNFESKNLTSGEGAANFRRFLFVARNGKVYHAYESGQVRFTGFKEIITGLVGSIHKFASDKPQKGYLKCDGGLYSTTTYADLFAEIGYTWGGSGSRFAVPRVTDKNRFFRSSGNGLEVGMYQDDAIRNIKGKWNGADDDASVIMGVTNTEGCFSSEKDSNRGYPGFTGGSYGGRKGVFDASRVVPTADENRPYACVVAYWIKY